VVSQPILASLVVGFSILGLNGIAGWYYEGNNYLAQLEQCFQIHVLYFFSKVGPPFVVPLVVSVVTRRLRDQASDYRFMEDAIPAMFLVDIPSRKAPRLPEAAVTKTNPSYTALFPLSSAGHLPEPALPPRYWREPSQRAAYFERLERDGTVAGMKADFVAPDGSVWHGRIYSRCVSHGKRLKVQGVIVPAGLESE
jgi:hypothetical protein